MVNLLKLYFIIKEHVDRNYKKALVTFNSKIVEFIQAAEFVLMKCTSQTMFNSSNINQ